MSGNVLRIPYGTKDVLPGEARMKRKMEDKIANTFLSWGYDEAETPTFEFADTFKLSGAITEESMRFMDRDNRTLMLRSEMTTPLARMVATRLKNDKGIKRLFYIANVFRHEETQQGRQCEFCQAGIELMGAEEPMADAEVLALAVNSLKAAGLQNFLISIGHSGFVSGLMEEAKLNAEQSSFVKEMILTHNSVGLKEAADSYIAEPVKDLFRELLYLQGGVAMLDDLETKLKDNAKCTAALENLKAIYNLADAYGVAEYLSFDLSLIRDFDYYTGMVFEAYAPHLGFNICGGGRYDHMMEAFGDPSPATGFAMGIDRIILSLRRDGQFNQESKWDIYVAWAAGHQQDAIKKAMELREGGKNVKIATDALTPEQAAKACAVNRCEAVAYVE